MSVFFPENIPLELKALPNWALWNKEIVSSKLKKVPYQVSGKKAKSNNPLTWCKFNTALTAYQDAGGTDGICFMMPVEPTKIIFIDIDHCIKMVLSSHGRWRLLSNLTAIQKDRRAAKDSISLSRGKNPSDVAGRQAVPLRYTTA